MTVTLVETVVPTAVVSPSATATLALRRVKALDKALPSLPTPAPKSSLLPPTPLPLPSHPTSTCPTTQTSTRPTPNAFSWSQTDEPHIERRRAILAAHPEIAELFGGEPLTFPIVVGLFLVQCLAAYALRSAPWPVLLVAAWLVSGTINHSLQLAVHELTHNLCFDSALVNKCAAIFANLVTCFPSSVSFQKYHHDHHQWQGVDGIDVDVPTHIESLFFITPALKVGWLFLQPLFYAFRPGVINPKAFGKWEAINFAVVLTFDALVLHFWGVKALAYLAVGTMLGLGLHPAAGHFIAEHYELVSGQETYSYYGAFNLVNFNVGYHNEHHDFPRVPWSRLPLVTRLAPEFYLTLPHYTSYLALFYAYITDTSLGPHARIKRARAEEGSRGLLKVGAEAKGARKMWIALLAISIVCLVAVCVGSMLL